MVTRSQRRLQLVALPLPRGERHGLLELQALHDSGGSHVSPDSTTPLPHLGVQSTSVSAFAPDGQQPSLAPAMLIGIGEHSALQPSPFTTCGVHASVGAQLVGQAPG